MKNSDSLLAQPFQMRSKWDWYGVKEFWWNGTIWHKNTKTVHGTRFIKDAVTGQLEAHLRWRPPTLCGSGDYNAQYVRSPNGTVEMVNCAKCIRILSIYRAKPDWKI